MNSTDEKLTAFFNAEIAPLKGKATLAHPHGWDTAENSHYVNRPEGAVTPTEFTGDDIDPAVIAARMDAMWADTPLAGMGAKLMDLAAEVEPEAEDGTVSDLIYEMF